MMSTQKEFFNQTICIGDILQNYGYKNIFIQGTDAKFAGIDKFFTEHGQYDIIDYHFIMKHKLINDLQKKLFFFLGS